MFLNDTALLILASFLSVLTPGHAQTTNWNNKKCAVVLTYDDALNVHLDKVIPALDSLELKATFYLIGSSPIVAARLGDWRLAAEHGHELGNHTLNHPCDGSLPGRGFVRPETDLNNYTPGRAVNEIRVVNTLLRAIDGKTERTFAYPCGDLKIGDSLYYKALKNDFIAARGVNRGYIHLKEADLSNLQVFSENNTTGEEMIATVKEAEKTGTLVIFLFHGVGGEHSLNVKLNEHKKLLNYLNGHKADIWVAPMVEVARYIKDRQ